MSWSLEATSDGDILCSCVNGRGAAQCSSCWRSCKVRGKMGEGGIDDRDIVMEVKGA